MMASWMPEPATVQASASWRTGPDAELGRGPRVRHDPLGGPLLGAAHLHGADRAQRALQEAAEPPDVFLGALLRRADARHEEREERGGHGHGGHGRSEQHQVEHAHQDQAAHQHDGAVDQADERLGGGLAEQDRVRGHAGDEFAGRAAGEGGHGGPQEPPHHRLARLQHDAFAHRAEHAPLPVRHGGSDDEEHEQSGHRAGEGGGVVQGVQHPLGDHRRGQAEGRAGQGQEQSDGQRAAVRAGEGPEDAQAGCVERGTGRGCRVSCHAENGTWMFQCGQVSFITGGALPYAHGA